MHHSLQKKSIKELKLRAEGASVMAGAPSPGYRRAAMLRRGISVALMLALVDLVMFRHIMPLWLILPRKAPH